MDDESTVSPQPHSELPDRVLEYRLRTRVVLEKTAFFSKYPGTVCAFTKTAIIHYSCSIKRRATFTELWTPRGR